MFTRFSNALDLLFDLSLVFWGFWCYWKKAAGSDRLPFLAVGLLATIIFGVKLFAPSKIGFSTLVALNWLCAIWIAIAFFAVFKHDRKRRESN